MSKLHTHYDNLKVARNAPDAVIRAAYKALMQKYHPDKFEGTEREALRIAKLIKQSFGILIDPIKRAEHDRWIDEKEAETKQASSKAQFGETADAAEQQFYQRADYPAPPKAAEPPPPSNWTDDQPNQKHDIAWRMVAVNFIVMLFIAYITYPIPADLKSSNAPIFLFIRIAIPALMALVVTSLFYLFRKKKEGPFQKRSFIIASWFFLAMIVVEESSSHKPSPSPKEVKWNELSDRARDLFKKSRFAEIIPMAEQGDPVAQLFMGAMYKQGKGVSKNSQQAVYFINKAYAQLLQKAEGGDAVAQLYVGRMLTDGVELDIPQDNQQGISWITKAAQHGNLEAQHELGRMNIHGKLIALTGC
jgi:TPR repeat protein